MTRPSRRSRVFVAAAAAGVLTATGLVAYATADSSSANHPDAIAQLAEGGGPGRYARAYGLEAADAVPVFTLKNGQTVSVVATAAAKCLIRKSSAAAAGETCDSVVAIDEGKAISVLDECGSSGRDLMEITGLAPAGVASARLIWTDGSGQQTPVTDGAFRFEGANPTPGAPYPTGISWVSSAGADVGMAAFPVQGDQFCLPAS